MFPQVDVLNFIFTLFVLIFISMYFLQTFYNPLFLKNDYKKGKKKKMKEKNECPSYFKQIFFNWNFIFHYIFKKIFYFFKLSFETLFSYVYFKFCVLDDGHLENAMRGWMRTVMMDYGPILDKNEFLFYVVDYFDEDYNTILLSRYFEKILIDNQETYEIYVERETQSISIRYLGVLHLVLKHNISGETHNFCCFEADPIQFLFDFIDEKYGHEYIDIQFGTKRLGNLRQEKLSTLNIQDGDLLILIVGKLEGGGEYDCTGCGETVKNGYGCEHGHCVPCREKNMCDCCLHIKSGPRCEHGKCRSRCVNDQSCTVCVENENPWNGINYGRNRGTKRKNAEDRPAPPSEPSFPINIYGNREDFGYLNEKQWIKFQCLICWIEYPHLFNSDVSLSFLFHKFLRNINPKLYDNEQEIVSFFESYRNKQITIFNFLHDIRQKTSDTIITITPSFVNDKLNNFVHTLVLVFHEYPELTLSAFLEKILILLQVSNPGIVTDFPVDINKFEFSLHAMSSIFSIVKNVNAHISNSKETSDFLNKILCSILFDNSSSPCNKDMIEFLEVSQYFVNIARHNLEDYKSGLKTNFSRHYKPREVFHADTVLMIQAFFDKHTILPDGNQMCSKRRMNGQESRKHTMKLIPCTIQEFYELFVLLHGDECKTCKNQHRVPKISFFMKQKPFYVRPLRKFRTGYCSICMQAKELIKTFRRFLLSHCKCKKLNCPTIKHEEGCPQILDEDDFCECSMCVCKNCKSCKVTDLTNSLYQFVTSLKCTSYTSEGRNYASLKCLTQKCKKCQIKTYKDLLNCFCPSILKNLDKSLKVRTRIWEEEEVETTTKSGKFKVWVMQPQEMKIVDFLNLFVKKLIEKRGILWHHNVAYFQKNQFHKMVSNIKKGVYGSKTVILVTDWAENYAMKDGRKLTAKQYYKNRKTQILGMVLYFFDGTKYKAVSNFVLSDLNVEKKCSNWGR